MESHLLRLEQGARDSETLDSIFRAIHSIKGSSATFGFAAIAQFTHTLETLLDAVRKRALEPHANVIDMLLECVDCVRHLLTCSEQNLSLDETRVAELADKIAALSAVASAPAVTPSAVSGVHTFAIDFRPQPQFFEGGNDPLSLFRMLETMGELVVEVDLSRLPNVAEFDPEKCYLAWRLTLDTDTTREQVLEIFEWVLDACDLEVTEVTASIKPDGAAASEIFAEATGHITQQKKPPARADSLHEDRTSSQLHVSTEKVDHLINLVGELVITQSMLSEIGSDFTAAKIPLLLSRLSQLERNTRELQESVMSVRMVPISHVFNRYVRMVRDMGAQLNKEIDLQISGEQCELDKSLIEKIIDPFAHLIRNSIDHGIETPQQRIAAGKPARGSISLHAEHRSGTVVVTIKDDGRGLNHEKIRAKAIERGLLDAKATVSQEHIAQFIFGAGFSTAAQVTDVSGRGVGLDVVRSNIQSIGGSVEVSSTPGQGTQFTLRLPLTLAILEGLLVTVGAEVFVLPLTQILESLRPLPGQINTIADCCQVLRIRDEYIPILEMHRLFGIPAAIVDPYQGIVVLLESEGSRFALQVDNLVGQQQVVMKNLESNYRKVDGMLGATILGNGRVALILDASALPRLHTQRQLAAA